MTESEIARRERENAALRAEADELREELNLPEWTPAEWARQAEELEAEVEEYPQERTDILAEAGHAWTRAGDLDRAERCYREASEGEGEPDMPDPRVHYASFLLEHRDETRGVSCSARCGPGVRRNRAPTTWWPRRWRRSGISGRLSSGPTRG